MGNGEKGRREVKNSRGGGKGDGKAGGRARSTTRFPGSLITGFPRISLKPSPSLFIMAGVIKTFISYLKEKPPSESDTSASQETVQESIMAVDETINNLIKELKQERKSHHKVKPCGTFKGLCGQFNLPSDLFCRR